MFVYVEWSQAVVIASMIVCVCVWEGESAERSFVHWFPSQVPALMLGCGILQSALWRWEPARWGHAHCFVGTLAGSWIRWAAQLGLQPGNPVCDAGIRSGRLRVYATVPTSKATHFEIHFIIFRNLKSIINFNSLWGDRHCDTIVVMPVLVSQSLCFWSSFLLIHVSHSVRIGPSSWALANHVVNPGGEYSVPSYVHVGTYSTCAKLMHTEFYRFFCIFDFICHNKVGVIIKCLWLHVNPLGRLARRSF